LSPKPVHKKEWIEKIISEARKNNIPIFVKENAKYFTDVKEYPAKLPFS